MVTKLNKHDKKLQTHKHRRLNTIPRRLWRERGNKTCLRGDVGVGAAISVEVVSVDVVTGRCVSVQLLQPNSRMVVGDHVGVAVLGLVDVDVRRLPRELATRVDRLVLGREQRSVVRFQSRNVRREVADLYWRMTQHR